MGVLVDLVAQQHTPTIQKGKHHPLVELRVRIQYHGIPLPCMHTLYIQRAHTMHTMHNVRSVRMGVFPLLAYCVLPTIRCLTIGEPGMVVTTYDHILLG